MELFGWYLLVMVVSSSLLIAMYSGILWRNWSGAKFSFIYLLGGIFLANNVALLTFAFADYEVYVRKNVSASYVWIVALLNGLMDLALCVSHCILAFRYRLIAISGPFGHSGKELPLDKRRKENVLFWGLLTVNIIMTLIETALSVCFYRTIFIKGSTPASELSQFLNLVGLMTGVLQIISGVLLVGSVLAIRKYINTRNDFEIRLWTLLVHTGAFGLYLLSYCVLCGTGVLYNLHPNNTRALDRDVWGAIFYNAASFASQFCLCFIFWDLSKKQVLLQLKEDDFKTIET
jgi:hypothetical protein